MSTGAIRPVLLLQLSREGFLGKLNLPGPQVLGMHFLNLMICLKGTNIGKDHGRTDMRFSFAYVQESIKTFLAPRKFISESGATMWNLTNSKPSAPSYPSPLPLIC